MGAGCARGRSESGCPDDYWLIRFLNQYMFRGIRQNSTGFATWPAVDLGIAAYSGDGGLKSAEHQLRYVEQPAQRRHRRRTVRAASRGTSPISTRRSVWALAADLVQHHLHRLHQPEQRVHHGQGNHFKLALDDSGTSRQGGGETVLRHRAGVRYRHRHRPGRRRRQCWHLHGDRPCSRATTDSARPASRFRSRSVSA